MLKEGRGINPAQIDKQVLLITMDGVYEVYYPAISFNELQIGIFCMRKDSLHLGNFQLHVRREINRDLIVLD